MPKAATLQLPAKALNGATTQEAQSQRRAGGSWRRCGRRRARASDYIQAELPSRHGRLARPLQLGAQATPTVASSKAAPKLPPRSTLPGLPSAAPHSPARRRRYGPVTLDGSPTSPAGAASVERPATGFTACASFATGGARRLAACNRCNAVHPDPSQISQIIQISQIKD